MAAGHNYIFGKRISEIDCSSKDSIETHPWWLVGDRQPISYEEYVSTYTQSKADNHFLRPNKSRPN